MNAPTRFDNVQRKALLTSHDFRVLADAGVFNEHARTELIEGELFVVNAIYAWHARVNSALISELSQALRGIDSSLVVYGPGSVAMSDLSVPEPDLSVGEREADESGPIKLSNIRLIVEIADSTSENDLGRKARLYAAHGIPEYWVVDRDSNSIVQHWNASDGIYGDVLRHQIGAELVSMAIPDLKISTDSLT